MSGDPRPRYVWPNLAKPEPISADPADHAEDFAHRWADGLDRYVATRMDELGIPTERIGSSDLLRGVAWRAFFPHERDGGGVATGGRINVDSGVLNPEFNAERIGPRAQALWERSRLRDRIAATIAHEFEEAEGGSHEYAVEHAPEIDLPIGGRARALLRAIRLGEQRFGR
jgi:hypothetical protein